MPAEPSWEQLADAYDDLLAQAPEDRARTLRLVSDRDPGLAARLVAMLDATNEGGHPLDRDVAAAAAELIGTTPAAPRQVGPYRLDRLLGEGGSAVVYLATRPDLDHQVAIKILRDAWLSPARRERFLLEQRTLAHLDHPAIARFHDADSFPDGTPWLAMEYVAGAPITEYVARRGLSATDTLRLVRRAAEAIQHAHQRAVIHRDLKPSNVLVTEDGAVKVVDFGIAKHLEATADPDPTRTGLGMMTPAYAAPEQLSRAGVGTYSDVYALGVVTWELLAGVPPYEARGLSAEQLLRLVQAGPPPVSSRLKSPVGRGIAADLDVLLATATHPDPTRRYRDMTGLIEDIDHLLAGEPLSARPDSMRYRVGKFVRRHAAPVVAATLTLAVVVALVAFYTIRLQESRDTALAEAARAERVQRFTQSLFEGGDPTVAPADSLRVLTLVDRGLQEVISLGDARARSDLLLTLGTIYQKLGRLDRADSLIEASLTERRSRLGATAPEVSDALLAQGLLRMDQARLDDAERLVREAIAIDSTSRPSQHVAHAVARTALGRVQEAKGDYPASIATLGQALRLHAARDSGSADYWSTAALLANSHFYAGDYDVADSINRLVLAVDRERRGSGHPAVAEDLVNLGATEFERGRYKEAERYYREALTINRAWYGADHHVVAAGLTMLGRALIRDLRWEEGAGSLEEALRVRERVFGLAHPNVASTVNELGTVALRRERFDEAERYYRRALEIYRKTYPGKHYLIGIALSNLGSVRMGQRDDAGAEAFLREALATFLATLDASHSNVGIARTKLGRALLRQGRYQDAIDECLAGYEILSKQASPALNFIGNARADLAAAYTALGRPADAARYRDSTTATPAPR
ncbi:MAG: tetratricopeptide repeat protein [Gemmatimonadales bacterium]